MTSAVRNSLIMLKANTHVLERPHRLPRAMAAAMTQGGGLLGAVAASAARYPDVIAISSPGHRPATYRQLWQRSNRLARGLARTGVGPGARVGIMCRNSPTFVYALLGATKLGADIVFLNTGTGAAQLAAVIEAEELTTVLHDDDFRRVLPLDAGIRMVDATEMSTLCAVHRSADLARPARRSRLTILTSGTTGTPRGAVRSSDAAGTDGVTAVLGAIPMRLRDTMVVQAPFFHAWGLSNLVIGLLLSATIVATPEFDAAQTLSLIAERRARVLVVVPAMLQRICRLPASDLAHSDTSSLTVIASSGSALNPRLAVEVLDRFGPVLYNVYGSTEVATATIAAPADLRTSPTTSGRPAPGVRVCVLDDNGASVVQGTVGHVFVANAAQFDGYTGGIKKTTRKGYLPTGDVGYFDEQGRLFVVGRADDMIVSGGENVYPSEVEDLLNADERIAEAVVVGVDDEDFGQILKAIVVVQPPHQIDVDDLKAQIAHRLAKFKVPRAFEFVDELPRNSTGKVLRRQLRSPHGASK